MKLKELNKEVEVMYVIEEPFIHAKFFVLSSN